MVKITLFSKEAYQFVTSLLDTPSGSGIQIRFYPEEFAVETEHQVLAKLLKKFASSQTLVLPFLLTKQQLIFASSDRRSLEDVMTAVQNFIIPTFAKFEGKSTVAHFRRFDPTKGDLQKAGHDLYPDGGYYRVDTHMPDFDRIMGRLELWLNLEEERPSKNINKIPSYHKLFHQFNEALKHKEYSEAEECIHQVRKLNLSTAENLYFWQVQLLASRNQWETIWNNPDFSSRTKLKMPRMVRAALLTAAYYSNLEELENQGNWGDALEVFKQLRPKLGLLLTGRFGLTQEPVLKMFAYQSVISEDADSLDELIQISKDSITLQGIISLKKSLPAIKTSIPPISPYKRILLALDEANFDSALEMIDKIPNEIDRALLLLEVAFFSGDLAGDVSRKALAYYQSLPDDKCQELQERNPQVLHYIYALELEIQSSSSETTWPVRIAILRESTWRIICELEILFRRIIEYRYENRFGDHWYEQINQEWRSKWALAQEKDQRAFNKYHPEPISILNYSYLGELMSMVNNNWTLFEDVFGPRKLNKPIFSQKLENVIKVRNPLAHNRPIPESELKLAEKHTREFLFILKKKSNHPVKVGV